jgi:hypothetical protein
MKIPRPVGYTPEPWRIVEDSSENAWLVVGHSPLRGACQIARIADAPSEEECRANARLIAEAPAMHRAAVRLMNLWGTEDASEAMEELAVVLSRAVKV